MACSDFSISCQRDREIFARPGPPIIASPMCSPTGFTLPSEKGPNYQAPLSSIRESDVLRVSRQEFTVLKGQIDQLLTGQMALQTGFLQIEEVANSQRSIQSMLTDFGLRNSTSVPVPVMVDQPPERAQPQSPASPESKAQQSKSAQSQFMIRAQERRIGRLVHMFEVDERVEKEQEALAKVTWRNKMEMLYKIDTLPKLNAVLDSVVLLVICLNTFFLGVAIDNPDHDDTWFVLDIMFSSCFMFELAVKTFTNGIKEEFCGHDRLANMFDASLIGLDIVQLAFKVLNYPVEGPSMSLFRMVRLGRFLRIFRLCRTEKFKDLLGMIQGMLGAMMTLVWAIVLFGMLLYIAALLGRETLGRKEREHIQEYFATVPRSMFTVFRCSFGDCTTNQGTPIFEFVSESYGGFYGFVYCVFVFLMTVGLFNVISAIFVESTMAAANDLVERKQQDRLADVSLLSCSVVTLIRRILTFLPESHIEHNLSNSVDGLMHVKITRAIIDEAILDPVAISALNDLDIDPHDHDKLSDILDPDHTGLISVLDLVNGLQRLRGQPRRSDIISVVLMLRSLQDNVEEMMFSVKEAHKKLDQK